MGAIAADDVCCGRSFGAGRAVIEASERRNVAKLMNTLAAL
jgi:hypothetical protein